MALSISRGDAATATTEAAVPVLRRHATLREDVTTALLSVVLVLGLYLDGWNHINLQDNELGAFLTPWHGVLYLGFTLTALWVSKVAGATRVSSIPALWAAVPRGYRFGLAGMCLVTLAAPGDAFWHQVFGVESGVARVIGPFHLVLFTGIALLVATPLRSAWQRPRSAAQTWRTLFPAIVSVGLLGGVAAFIVQFSSAYVIWRPSISLLEALPASVRASPALLEATHRAAVAQVLLTTAVVVAPVLLAAARWRLPFGAGLLMTTIIGLLCSGLNELQLPPVLASAVVGGLAADWTLMKGQHLQFPGAVALTGAAMPLAMWMTFFAALQVFEGVAWPRDLWLGATGLAAIFGVVLGLAITACPADAGER